MNTASFPYYVRALALAIPAILLGLQIPGWIGFVGIVRDGHGDFRQLYTAGYMVRSGHAHELYELTAQKRFQDAFVSHEQIALPFNHLADEALLLAPFSFFGYRTAYCWFLALNLCLLALSYRSLRPYLENLSRVHLWLPALLFITFIPVAAALMQGQDSILLLVLLTASFTALSDEKEVRAGIFAGLGIFKFQLVLPIACMFLLWRRWRFVGGLSISSVVAVALSWLLVGSGQMKQFLHMLLSMSLRLSTGEQYTFGILPNYMPNLRGLLYGIGNGLMSPLQLQGLTALSSLLALIAVAKISRKLPAPDAFLLSITVAAVVSYHLLIHDLSILLLPIAVILNRTVHTEGIPDRKQFLFRLAVLAFFLPASISFFPSRFYLFAIPLLALLATFCYVSTRPKEDVAI
jgi:Glycosyltransferase family 87